MKEATVRAPRNIAIVGPYLAGKTTLLESLLYVSGTLHRKGSVREGTSLGDASSEARQHQMSVEMTPASITYNDIPFTFLDCPGSVEFLQEANSVLVGVEAAIVVCEPEPERVLTLAPLLKFLDDWEIPHVLFINKLDRFQSRFQETLQALKSVSSRPFVVQQFPIQKGDQLLGYIDLVTEQAYLYHANAPADPIPLPQDLQAEEQATRAEMLEALSEFDDHLLEELVEEIEPPQEEIERDLKFDLGADLIVPVFCGVAEQDYGVRPLLQALVQQAPAPGETAARRPLPTGGVVAQVLKTLHTSHGGKLSLVRVWQGMIKDGMTLNGNRISGIYRLMGQTNTAIPAAEAGEIVALGRLDNAKTGDTLTPEDQPGVELPQIPRSSPVYALAIATEQQSDQVKLSSALSRLMEEDPSLFWEHRSNTHETLLWGQGEIHLQVTLERLQRKYNLPVQAQPPQIPYQETIRHPVAGVHGRYKHQTGGHGQFGDVYLDLEPLPRGSGFRFTEKIVGGVVPKQYISGVESGIREFLDHGPLGYPLVDLGVTLTNGSYHSVDSSEQAFKQAARIAMTEGTPQGDSVLLEPILQVAVAVPNLYTSQVLQLLSRRRSQIQGYQLLSNWKDWDQVEAYLPQAEMQDFIVELRSLTFGVGTFKWQFDHMQEVPQKLVQQMLEEAQERNSNGRGSGASRPSRMVSSHS
ncbi:MAG: elongation factor G [Synechococcaceae cyanobacterium SM2_3_1]|nr:elongation factor G [Synechococcaceae cyanobacterium SM2_3_1]